MRYFKHNNEPYWWGDFYFPLQIAISTYTFFIQNYEKSPFYGRNEGFCGVFCVFLEERGLWLAYAIIFLSQTYFKKEQFHVSIISEIWWYTQVTNCSCAFGNFDSSMERISRSLTALQKIYWGCLFSVSPFSYML